MRPKSTTLTAHESEPVGFAWKRPEGGLDVPLRLLQIRAERVSPETVKEVLTQAGVSVGDPITRESVKRIELVAQSMDEHFRVAYKTADDGVVLMLLAK